MNKDKVAIFSPIAIISLGFISASVFKIFMQEWAFIPLALIYWSLTFVVAYRCLGKASIVGLFAKPEKSIPWIALCFVVGLIPLPILLLNLNLLVSPLVTVMWLAFAAVNPFFEEIYWRGFLLKALPFSKAAAILYSTLFFIASHPLMWGVFSIANRSWMVWASLLLMGVVWSIACLKTNSLWWCVISHFLVDVFNLSVFVFLNLYIPPAM